MPNVRICAHKMFVWQTGLIMKRQLIRNTVVSHKNHGMAICRRPCSGSNGTKTDNATTVEVIAQNGSMTAEFYREYQKFWGEWPGEDVWPILDGRGYFDPRTGARMETMKKLRQ